MKQLLLAFALLSLGACKKDAPEAELPAATEVGANTGGCLIDGEPFVATGWGGGLLSNPIPALFGGFAFDSVYYVQLAGSYKGNNAYVMLFMRPVTTPGTYLLNRNTQYYPQGDPLLIYSHATFYLADNQNDFYVTDKQRNGEVIITRADLKNSIGSGTFEFTAASQVDPTRTVHITSGRFDRKR